MEQFRSGRTELELLFLQAPGKCALGEKGFDKNDRGKFSNPCFFS